MDRMVHNLRKVFQEVLVLHRAFMPSSPLPQHFQAKPTNVTNRSMPGFFPSFRCSHPAVLEGTFTSLLAVETMKCVAKYDLAPACKLELKILPKPPATWQLKSRTITFNPGPRENSTKHNKKACSEVSCLETVSRSSESEPDLKSAEVGRKTD